MRQPLIPNIIVSSLLCFGLTAAASAQPPAPYGRYDRAYGATSAADFHDNQLMFARVRSDLDRAENNLRPFSDSHYSFDRVRGELSELQRQWDENGYQPSQVDNVIRALDRSLASSELLPRDRDRLSEDLSSLRDFRDTHE
jgi:hypothetical protein